jgi:uroporphyrinogen decarboxylase
LRGPGSYEDSAFTADEAKAVAVALGHDNICFTLHPPVYADRTVEPRVGFDVVVTLDDIAFKTAPFFSPQVFRDLVLPRYERIGKALTLPWVVHSDGNVALFLDDLARVGIAGVHPMEKGAIDIRWVKQTYGDRLCILGNVDMHLLSVGPAEAVERETQGLLRDVAPGGGYILTSGNSIASYCQVEYVRAMCGVARKFGRYPIDA